MPKCIQKEITKPAANQINEEKPAREQEQVQTPGTGTEAGVRATSGTGGDLQSQNKSRKQSRSMT